MCEWCVCGIHVFRCVYVCVCVCLCICVLPTHSLSHRERKRERERKERRGWRLRDKWRERGREGIVRGREGERRSQTCSLSSCCVSGFSVSPPVPPSPCY